MLNKIKVVIIQCICPHYRVPFFKKLAEKVDLTLFYGVGEKKGSWQNAKNIDGFNHKKLFSISLKFHIKDFPVRLVWFPNLLFVIHNQEPEVIITEGFTNIINNIFIWSYCKIFSIPLIMWDGGRRKEKPMNFLRKLIEPINIFLLKQTKAIIAYGSIAKTYFISLGINPEKIFVAQNTIDVKACFKNAERIKANPEIIQEIKKKYILNGKKVILYIGSLEKRKNIDNLIKIFNELKKRISNIALLIIGDGSYKEELLNLVKEENIKDCLFLGRIIENTEIYFMLSDVFVQPGWNSLATIEAQAYGKPVITVKHGGPEYEVIKNGETGFVIERGNSNKLKWAISKIICNKTLKKQMGICAQQRVKFITLDNMVREFSKAIKDLAKHDPRYR